MSALFLVWALALSLAVMALVGMLVLIALRLVRERVLARREAGRALIVPALIAHIGAPNGPALALHGYEHDAELMGEIIRDVAKVIRGGERARLMQALSNAGVDECLRAALRGGTVNQRVAACEALVLFSDPRSRQALMAAESDKSGRVRLAAAHAAIEIGATPLFGDVLDRAISGRDGSSLLFAELLRRVALTQAEAAIAALARADLPHGVRMVVLQAVGATRDPRALPALLAATASPDAELRAGAFAALGALGHPGARDHLSNGLTDEDWRVRLKAIECIKKLGLIEFAESVSALAHDDIWWVRHRAGEALLALAEQNVVALRSLVSTTRRPLPAPDTPAPATPAPTGPAPTSPAPTGPAPIGKSPRQRSPAAKRAPSSAAAPKAAGKPRPRGASKRGAP